MSDASKQRRVWYIIGSVLIVGFFVYGANAFRQSLTPYVSITEAKSSGAKVQVAGKLVDGSSQVDEQGKQLRFELADSSNQVMTVLYDGVKPGNFEEATQIVVIGRWTEGAFHAEQMLVKCPSKYQGEMT